MPRPLRALDQFPRTSRRRHRTWIVSMTLATLAMASWSVAVIWMRLDRPSAPSPETTFLVASFFAVPGFLLGLLTVRAKASWVLFAVVPVLMNGMILFLPWLVLWLGENRP